MAYFFFLVEFSRAWLGSRAFLYPCSFLRSRGKGGSAGGIDTALGWKDGIRAVGENRRMEGGFHLELCLAGGLGNGKRQQAKAWQRNIK